jgi:hypothetical protein
LDYVKDVESVPATHSGNVEVANIQAFGVTRRCCENEARVYAVANGDSVGFPRRLRGRKQPETDETIADNRKSSRYAALGNAVVPRRQASYCAVLWHSFQKYNSTVRFIGKERGSDPIIDGLASLDV